MQALSEIKPDRYRYYITSLICVLKVKEESEEVGLKLNIQKAKIMASVPSLHWKYWGNSRNSVRLYFFCAPKSLQLVIAAMKLKDAYSLEEKL